MVRERHVLVAELGGVPGHLLDRRAAVGPVRVQVEVAAQRGPDGRTGAGVGRGLGPEPGEALRLLGDQVLPAFSREPSPV